MRTHRDDEALRASTRSFCYVDDLLEVIILLMESSDQITGPVNAGNPFEFSIKELAEKIIDFTGSSSKLKYESLPSDDPIQRQPDITQAKELLGWEP